jgi:hypothetical protein
VETAPDDPTAPLAVGSVTVALVSLVPAAGAAPAGPSCSLPDADVYEGNSKLAKGEVTVT